MSPLIDGMCGFRSVAETKIRRVLALQRAVEEAAASVRRGGRCVYMQCCKSRADQIVTICVKCLGVERSWLDFSFALKIAVQRGGLPLSSPALQIVHPELTFARNAERGRGMRNLCYKSKEDA